MLNVRIPAWRTESRKSLGLTRRIQFLGMWVALYAIEEHMFLGGIHNLYYRYMFLCFYPPASLAVPVDSDRAYNDTRQSFCYIRGKFHGTVEYWITFIQLYRA